MQARGAAAAVSGRVSPMDSRERLIFALDVATRGDAEHWIDTLGDTVTFYKIGMELLTSGEYFAVLDLLASRGKQVFVDLKFHDVPATVAATVRGLGRWPVAFCTIHGQHRAMVDAAVAARGSLRLLAVTVLTSIDAGELRSDGDGRQPAALALARARAAWQAGCDGVVCSGQEAAAVRAMLPAEKASDFAIVCPGIRPAFAAADDQKRTVSVAQAFANGASHIVVGRPIRSSSDPRAAAEAMQGEIRAALSIG